MKKNCMKWVALMLIIGFLAASVAIAAEEQGVVGTVEKTDQGIVISTEDGAKYAVKGKDLSSLVGKVVWVKGSASGNDFTVNSVEVDE